MFPCLKKKIKENAEIYWQHMLGKRKERSFSLVVPSKVKQVTCEHRSSPRLSNKRHKTGEVALGDVEAPGGVLAALEQVMHSCPVGFHTSPAGVC